MVVSIIDLAGAVEERSRGSMFFDEHIHFSVSRRTAFRAVMDFREYSRTHSASEPISGLAVVIAFGIDRKASGQLDGDRPIASK
jgi:hypothetical protein